MSVLRQKGESQNGSNKRIKQKTNFSENQIFLDPLIRTPIRRELVAWNGMVKVMPSSQFKFTLDKKKLGTMIKSFCF